MNKSVEDVIYNLKDHHFDFINDVDLHKILIPLLLRAQLENLTLYFCYVSKTSEWGIVHHTIKIQAARDLNKGWA